MTSDFSCSDFSDFREWLALDLNGITWQGRYEDEFEQFWSLFFCDNLSIAQVMKRFDYAEHDAKIGPMVSWFSWLRQKFLIYSFVYKGLSVYDLAKEADIDISLLSNILRDFFLTRYFQYEEYFNTVFQIGSIVSENAHLTFSEMAEEIRIDKNFDGGHADEIMPSMEITLYEEWEVFLAKMQKNFLVKDLKVKGIKSREKVSKTLKFFRDVTLLLGVGIALIFLVQRVNRWYESYLSNKISVYEPQFLWLDKSLKFQTPEEQLQKGEKIDFDEITVEESGDIDIDEDRDVIGSTRFSEESEVVLTSWDSLPKDFETADLEQSEYEEQRKGGYRDSKYGSRTVYRAIIVSVDPMRARKNINKLLERYEATQVDRVKPGTRVPGGIYYSLFVPTKYLREFLGQIEYIDDATIYKSHTRRRNPPGMGKIFIWVKVL